MNYSLAVTALFLLSIVGSTPADDLVEMGDSPAISDPTNAPANTDATNKIIEYPEELWAAAGIAIQPAQHKPFSKTVTLTGKVTLNQDRIAHVYPMVEGAVDSVNVSLGQLVKENDELVVIHSREVGEAKLLLYQASLQLELANVKHRLQDAITKNARELITALREQNAIAEIESQFRNRPMGDYRERLLAAYSNYLKSEADVTRLASIAESGAISGNQLLSAKANRNADLATFQSRIEQIEYEIETAALLSSQSVKEAETRVAVASTSLRILGCSESDISDVNPAQQGETISHYSIRAPFDGTVLTKDVVLGEQVRPDVLVLSIADLSTVWITADVYEEHIPLLSQLENQKVVIRNAIWPDRRFEGQIFYKGEVMDEATRTISLRATMDNSDRLLKPGMFINVEITGTPSQDAIVVPRSAVQEHQGAKFVYIHLGQDQFARRDVQLGQSNEDSVILSSGIKLDERVVVKGGFLLKSKMLAELMGEE